MIGLKVPTDSESKIFSFLSDPFAPYKDRKAPFDNETEGRCARSPDSFS